MKNADNIKAIFFDIDGTLVSFRTHRMSERTRRALDRLREKGILAFAATGRRLADINNLGGWQPDGYVTMNGSLCVVGGEVIHRRTIDPRDVNALADRLEQGVFYPFAVLGADTSYITGTDEKFGEAMRLINMRPPRETAPGEIRGMEIYQMLGFFGEESQREAAELLPNCGFTRWTHLFTDIVPAGSCKWAGISKVIEKLGIAPEETMAFGDGGNDIEMLAGAGIGVAMGNAAPEVKKHADYVAASVDRGGVAKALEYFRIL